MPDWVCTECDWRDTIPPAEAVRHYCPQCGARTMADLDLRGLHDAETRSDKV